MHFVRHVCPVHDTHVRAEEVVPDEEVWRAGGLRKSPWTGRAYVQRGGPARRGGRAGRGGHAGKQIASEKEVASAQGVMPAEEILPTAVVASGRGRVGGGWRRSFRRRRRCRRSGVVAGTRTPSYGRVSTRLWRQTCSWSTHRLDTPRPSS